MASNVDRLERWLIEGLEQFYFIEYGEEPKVLVTGKHMPGPTKLTFTAHGCPALITEFQFQ